MSWFTWQDVSNISHELVPTRVGRRATYFLESIRNSSILPLSSKFGKTIINLKFHQYFFLKFRQEFTIVTTGKTFPRQNVSRFPRDTQKWIFTRNDESDALSIFGAQSWHSELSIGVPYVYVAHMGQKLFEFERASQLLFVGNHSGTWLMPLSF